MKYLDELGLRELIEWIKSVSDDTDLKARIEALERQPKTIVSTTAPTDTAGYEDGQIWLVTEA